MEDYLKIVLSGYYGMSNYGDDLFSIVSYAAAKHFWKKDIDVKIASPRVEEFFGQYSVPNFFSEIYASHGTFGGFARVFFQAASFARVNKVVFAGGSLFTAGNFSTRDIATYSFRRERNLWAIGISVGPFKSISDEKKIFKFLSKFEYISTRDKISFELLASSNLDCSIVESADLAGLTNMVFPKKDRFPIELNETFFNLGFSPCYIPGNSALSKHYCDIFLDFASKIRTEKQLLVKIICLNQHPQVGDLDLCFYVKSKLEERGINCCLIKYKDMGVLKTWDLISTLDFYVTVRLHGAVTAFLNNVKFHCIEYHRKSTDFLDFIGMPNGFRVEPEVSVESLEDTFNKSFSLMLPSRFESMSKRSFTFAPI